MDTPKLDASHALGDTSHLPFTLRSACVTFPPTNYL